MMSDTQWPGAGGIQDIPVSQAGLDVRQRFMTRVYGHLIAAIVGFVAIEVVLFTTGVAYTIANFVFDTSWLLILGGFMVVSWLATTAAHKYRSGPMLYAAFGALIVAEALIFVPMLAIAADSAPGAIGNAAWISLIAFVGLSGIAVTSSKDFSFLGSLLKWGFVVAIILIVASVIMGLNLGTWFTVGMIALAGGAILYDTQRIYNSYPADREVAAAMSLFASLALLFWYVLRLFSRR